MYLFPLRKDDYLQDLKLVEELSQKKDRLISQDLATIRTKRDAKNMELLNKRLETCKKAKDFKLMNSLMI
jgi:hypothetical protein